MRKLLLFFVATSIVLSITLFFSPTAMAFIGNKLFGKHMCVVACGRGPFGIAPLGDVIKGANEMVFGPTLDGFEQKGKNIVDYASRKFDEKLMKLDSNLDQNLSKLTEVMQDGISQLDDVLRSNIDVGLEGLTRKIEALDILGSKKSDELNGVLRGAIIFLASTLLILWIVKSIFDVKGGWRKRFGDNKWKIAGAACAIVAIYVVPQLVPSLHYRIPKIRSQLEMAYVREFRALEFNRAAFIAEKLATIDPEDPVVLRRRDAAALLRDVYFTPTTYRTLDGLARIEARLLSLLRPGVPDIGAGVGSERGIEDSDLELTMALVEWQVRQDSGARLLVANVCAVVAERELKKDAGQQAPLLPLAGHYIRSYLLYPISNREVDLTDPSARSDKQDEFLSRYALRSNEQIAAVLKELSARGFGRDQAQGRFVSLTNQLSFSDSLGKTYGTAIPSYFAMVEANAKLKLPGANKDTLVQVRNAAATKTIEAWEHLLESSGAALNDDLSARLSMVTALHATYSRAQQYLKSDASGNVPGALLPADVEAGDLASRKTFHDLWLSQIVGSIRPSGMPMVRYRIKGQFLQDQGKLVDFEKAFGGVIASRTKVDARTAGKAASDLGLFVCTAKDVEDLNSNFDLVPCDIAAARPLRAVWYVRSLLAEGDKTIVEGWVDLLKASFAVNPPTI